MQLKNDLNDLMQKYNLLNFEDWQSIDIDHSGEYRENLLRELRNCIPNGSKFSGIYVYTYLNEGNVRQVLYIGKSKSLPSRLYNHYRERHGKAGISVWPAFWGGKRVKMRIYFKEIGDSNISIGEALRIIIERWLIVTYNPESEQTRRSIK